VPNLKGYYGISLELRCWIIQFSTLKDGIMAINWDLKNEKLDDEIPFE
jgi:hypothetical protein